MVPNRRYTLVIYILLLLSFNCKAQKYEWVNFIEGQNNEEAVSMSVDPSGNQYSTFDYVNDIKFGSVYLKDSTNRPNVLVLKQNTYGKIIWYSTIKVSTKQSWVQGLASRFNSTGNLIIFVVSPVDIVIGTDTIKRKGTVDYALYIVEFDKNGKMVSGKNLIEGSMDLTANNLFNVSNRFASDQNDNVYFSHIFKGQIKIYDSKGVTNYGSSSSISRNIIFKFSNSGQKFEWANELPYKAASAIWINSLKVDIHENLYAAAYWGGGSTSTVSFKGKTLSNPQGGTGAIFIWDKNGKDKNWFYIQASGKSSTITDIAVHDSNSIFVSGAYLGDSAKFDTMWKRNKKYGGYYFFALYNIKGNVKWVKTEDTSYSSSINYFNAYGSMINYIDKFFYRSLWETTRSGNPIIFDGQKYMPGKNPENGIHLKFDERGNILWGFRTKGAFGSMATDDNNNLYFQGYGSGDTIRFGSIKHSPVGNDSYIGKTFDYAIFRGKVNSGPYCAGDSFYVPYTKIGEFADTNIFIAEISDEFGNFTGKERELGRIKSKNDGTIRGVLPMFQVASSGNYRIRIRSTSPQAQSFYKVDTLRLLIYSRDKANPGPPETICMGDSLKLNTYGGTKWTWSSKYRMDDSTKRQPIVWPTQSTTYKIIIADSSGCGAPDTAFKKVIVRPALKTVLAFNDTTVCGDGALRIPYYFTGGDSVNYRFQWYFVSNPKLWFTMKSGQNLLRDTLIYTPSDPIEKLAIILKDGCTNKADTAYLIISQRKPVTIKSTYRDATLCTGNLLKYKATASGGVAKQYRYQWKDLVTNSILSTTDSLKFLTKKTLKIQLIVNDGCEALGDTAEFEVMVKAELKAITNLRDTTICAGKTLNYTATATGGDSKAYKFLWLLNGKQIDTINHLQLTINNSSTLSLITTDNCSSNDTVTKKITVNPAPKADFSWDLACSRTVTKFQFTGSKPSSPITTIFHWNFNNESPSYLENPSYLFTVPGTKTLTLALTSSNGCTDTIKKDVVIKPQSKADFTATDVCESDSASFKNLSKDATGYLWKFGDGQNSKLQNPRHKYQISSTTTYNVTLVAQVANGCSDSISKAVTINKNPSSDFSYSYNGVKVDLKITKAGNSYQWKFGTTDSAKTTSTTYSHTIKSSDQTKVCLTATDNISSCSSQTCKNVSVGILKVSEKSFKIYPNPNSGSFTIEIEHPAKDVSIEIFNLLGKLVGRVEKVEKVNSLDLNVADGMYWVRVKNGEVVWNQKISVSFGVDTNR